MKRANLIFRVVLLLLFAIITVATIFAIPYTFDSLGGLIATPLMIGAYFFTLPLLILVVCGKNKSPVTPWTTVAAVVVYALPFLYVLAGFVSDLLGVRCRGLFGAQWSCYDERLLGIWLTILQPQIIALWIVPIAVLVSVSIVAEARSQRSK